MRMIERKRLLDSIAEGLTRAPVVSVLGPRQVGKTTLARLIAREHEATIFDIEDPRARARLEQPVTALEGLRGLVVID